MNRNPDRPTQADGTASLIRPAEQVIPSVDVETRKRRIAVAQVELLKLLARGILQMRAKDRPEG